MSNQAERKGSALEAAAEALYGETPLGGALPWERTTQKEANRRRAKVAVTAYLDALLAELPEEAMVAVRNHRADSRVLTLREEVVFVFLRSLRSAVGGGAG